VLRNIYLDEELFLHVVSACCSYTLTNQLSTWGSMSWPGARAFGLHSVPPGLLVWSGDVDFGGGEFPTDLQHRYVPHVSDRLPVSNFTASCATVAESAHVIHGIGPHSQAQAPRFCTPSSCVAQAERARQQKVMVVLAVGAGTERSSGVQSRP
jgi:hypothetical protein